MSDLAACVFLTEVAILVVEEQAETQDAILLITVDSNSVKTSMNDRSFGSFKSVQVPLWSLLIKIF